MRPKRPGEGEFSGPLNYAYHFDAARLADVLSARACALGVAHLRGTLTADLYIGSSGFRAELIGEALQSPFKGAKHQLFTDRALACKLPYDRPDVPIESYTIAAAFRGARLKLLDPSRIAADAGEDDDWREAMRTRSPWIRNLFIRG